MVNTSSVPQYDPHNEKKQNGVIACTAPVMTAPTYLASEPRSANVGVCESVREMDERDALCAC